MAHLVIGDWDCKYEDIISIFKKYPKICERRVLSTHLGTSEDFMECLEGDLEKNKINSVDAMIEVLVEWRSRNLKRATLGALLEILGKEEDWTPIRIEVKDLLAKKAKTWLDLDHETKDQILSYEVEFQGNQFPMRNLQYMMNENFHPFLLKYVNQKIIQQVINREPLQMKSQLQEGFITSLVAETSNASKKIEFQCSKEFELGSGSCGTVVYKGKFDRHEVAVKKILNFRLHAEAENEIQFLLTCKGNQNIVQYYTSENHGDSYLLALELCLKTTLQDWIADSKCLPLEIEGLEILRQATEGLDFLHENNIIHRDLKPSNILFSIYGKKVFVKIADFGISRLLPPGQNSKTVTSYGGSSGWTAAEMLEARQIYNETGSWATRGIPKITKKIDIFAAGCIFFVVLSCGQHPFGPDETLYDYNIKHGKSNTDTANPSLALKRNLALIERMIHKFPNNRPNTAYIRAHPIFWSRQKMLNFIVEISNLCFKNFEVSTIGCCLEFEQIYFPKTINVSIPHLGWLGSLSDENRKVFCDAKYDKYKDSVVSLVRLIRNLNNHYNEVPAAVKEIIGEKPNEFMSFWLDNFPTLIHELREAFSELASTSSLKQFYVLNPLI